MSKIPKENSFDSTLSLLKEGYTFIPSRRKRLQSDIFQTRLMGKKVICMGGKEAAELFYDPAKFERKGALPKRIKNTLLGQKGVQTLDGEEHHHRKALFMSFMTKNNIQELLDYFRIYWHEYMGKWEQEDQIRLFDEVQEILCRAACAWTGIPIEDKEVASKAQDFSAMVDAFGAAGPRHRRGKQARKRMEAWIEGLVVLIREKKLIIPKNMPSYNICWHKDMDGELLDTPVAAVEIINLIRPIVAIATYITFSALALHRYPDQKEKIKNGDVDHIHRFIQEIRRFYPFGPFLGAHVRDGFEWQGFKFKKGTLTLLDIYGTNRDPAIWDFPDQFNPDRFLEWSGSPFDFIPQGGGDHYFGHRCAGEWITIEMAKMALLFFVKNMTYKVPDQDLSFDLSRMPTKPKSRFIITEIKSVDISNIVASEAFEMKFTH